MIASTFARCQKSLPHAAALPSRFKSLCASPLRLINPRRTAFTLRAISDRPISEKEKIRCLEKSLRMTQLLGIYCTSLMMAGILIAFYKIESVEECLDNFNDGFEGAGKLLAKEFRRLNKK
jgi:hypothetical protein